MSNKKIKEGEITLNPDLTVKDIQYSKQQERNLYKASYPHQGKYLIVNKRKKNNIINKDKFENYKPMIKRFLNLSENYYPNDYKHPYFKNLEIVEELFSEKKYKYSKIVDELINQFPNKKEMILDIDNLYIKNKDNINNNNKSLNYFNPFNINDFYLKIANIDYLNYDSLLNFSNKYGIFGDNREYIPLRMSNINHKHNIGNEINLIKYMREIKKLKYCIILWKEISDLEKENIPCRGRNEKFKKRVKKDYNNNYVYFDHYLLTYRYPSFDDLLFELSPFNLAKFTLKSLINDKLLLVKPILQFGKEMSLLPAYSTNSLLGVAYTQLYEGIIENNNLGKCKYCGDYFTQKDPSNKYCPEPKTASGRSKHENRYNQMKYSWKKKIKNGKVTIKEASKKIGWHDSNGNKKMGRRISEIKSWFK